MVMLGTILKRILYKKSTEMFEFGRVVLLGLREGRNVIRNGRESNK